MAEETFYKEDFDRGAEYHSDPELTVRPEFNDLASQKPSPPRREKNRSGFLKGMLGSAVRGGAAVIAAAAVVTSIATGTQQNIGETASKVKDIVSPATRPAFTQQDGLTPGDFALLWESDPAGPHKYDHEHPVVLSSVKCTEDTPAELVCLECGLHVPTVLPAQGHKETEPVRENEVLPTCTKAGRYESVVKCSVCGEELSRTPILVAAAGHTEGQSELISQTEASCAEDGVRTEMIYCAVCGEEMLIRRTVTEPALSHTPGEPVENVIKRANCTEGGSTQFLTYCTVCGALINYNVVDTPPKGHTPGTPVAVNQPASICTTGGTYEEVTYCSVCKAELSRRSVTVTEGRGHTPGERELMHEEPASCQPGFKEYVIRCTVCGEILDSESEETPPTGQHVPGEPQKVYINAAKTQYQMVTSCSVCGEELSRGEVQTEEVHVHDFGLEKDGAFSPPAEGAYLSCSEDGTAAARLVYNSGDAPSMTLYLNSDFREVIAKYGYSMHSIIFGPIGEGPEYFTDSSAATITAPISDFESWGNIKDVSSGMQYRVDIWFGEGNTEYHIVSNTITVP